MSDKPDLFDDRAVERLVYDVANRFNCAGPADDPTFPLHRSVRAVVQFVLGNILGRVGLLRTETTDRLAATGLVDAIADAADKAFPGVAVRKDSRAITEFVIHQYRALTEFTEPEATEEKVWLVGGVADVYRCEGQAKTAIRRIVESELANLPAGSKLSAIGPKTKAVQLLLNAGELDDALAIFNEIVEHPLVLCEVEVRS